jgi:hypothetical protein
MKPNLNPRYAIFGLAVYLVSLVATLPAREACRWLKTKAAFAFEIYQPSGTVWNGRAAAMRIAGVTFDSSTWHFRPWPMLLGRIEYALDLRAGKGGIQTIAGQSLNGSIYLRDLRLRMPLADIVGIAGQSNLGLEGDVSVDLPNVVIRARHLARLDGTIQVSDAGTSPPANVSLGGATIRLQTTQQGMRGILKDTGGPLIIEGVLTLQPDGTYQLAGNLAVRDPARADLVQALGFLGAPGSGGRVNVNYQGRIPLEQLIGR